MKNKSKLLNTLMVLCLLPTICACKDNVSEHEKQGFKQEVIYNLGDGLYRGNNRDTNLLTLFYKPGSYITDITTIRNYDITYDGYELEGWYLDDKFNQKVDFNTYKLADTVQGPINLYAKWNMIVHKYFDLYFINDEGISTFVDSIAWQENVPYSFSKSQFTNDLTTGYTYINAYVDQTMLTPIDENYLLTETSADHMPIYTKWLKGNYKVVASAKDFIRSLGSYSLYIDADIDLEGQSIGSAFTMLNQTIIGNGHTISNVSYTTLGKENASKQTVTLGLLASSLENCVIKDLTFENVTYTLDVATCRNLQVGVLAGSLTNCQISNVSVSGTMVYSENIKKRLASEGIDKLESSNEITSAIAYNVDENSTVTDCIYNITVDKGE